MPVTSRSGGSAPVAAPSDMCVSAISDPSVLRPIEEVQAAKKSVFEMQLQLAQARLKEARMKARSSVCRREEATGRIHAKERSLIVENIEGV